MSRSNPKRPRHDGWTTERQLRFIEALGQSKSVSNAAAAAGISRESAYRLRQRREGALFAAFWDRALEPRPAPEVHTAVLSDGVVARLLGTHYRRKTGLC